MIKGTSKATEYTTYAFSEQELKGKLGIDDPHGVLTVSVDFTSRTITVTMSADT